MVRSIDRLDMTLVVDWDVTPKNQTKQKFKLLKLFLNVSEFSRRICAKFRGVFPGNLAE